METRRTSGDCRLSHRSGCRSKRARQKRSDPVASRCTHALRRSRKSPSRRRRRPSTQEQEWLDADDACDSEYRSWWLGLTRSESTTGADRPTASRAHYQTDLIRPVWVWSNENERPGGGQPTGACSEWNNDPASGNFAPLAPIPLNASSLKSQFLTSFNLRRFSFRRWLN